MSLNKIPFQELSQRAKSKPETWITVREQQSSANLVTRIRKGEVQDFNPKQFNCRSSRYQASSDDSGPIGTVYDIEVMYKNDQSAATPAGKFDSTSITLEQFNTVLQDPDVQRAITAALARLGRKSE